MKLQLPSQPAKPRFSLVAIRIPMLIALVLGLSVICALADAETQADALLAKMTLDEKIGQMVQPDMLAVTNSSDVKNYFLGSILSGGNSDPPVSAPFSTK